jgi:Holliday junction resolvase RusA-like endonuclease
MAKEDIDNLSNLYDFCNKTGIHYEDDKIEPTLEELKEKIRLFFDIRQKIV